MNRPHALTLTAIEVLSMQGRRGEEELRLAHIMHRFPADINPVETMELLLKQLSKHKTNAEFLNGVTLT